MTSNITGAGALQSKKHFSTLSLLEDEIRWGQGQPSYYPGFPSYLSASLPLELSLLSKTLDADEIDSSSASTLSPTPPLSEDKVSSDLKDISNNLHQLERVSHSLNSSNSTLHSNSRLSLTKPERVLLDPRNIPPNPPPHICTPWSCPVPHDQPVRIDSRSRNLR